MKNKIVKQIPNAITLIRIAAAIVMIFLKGMSLEFFLVYGFCAITDFLDGFIARRFKLTSKLGSILDSLADLIFYASMAYKIFPTMVELLTIGNRIVIIGVTCLHILAYIICAIKYKKFSSLHTYANKTLSWIIFVFPFTLIGGIYLLYNIYIYGCGVIAAFSAIEINLIHILSKEYDTKNKSIFILLRKTKKEKNEKISNEITDEEK